MKSNRDFRNHLDAASADTLKKAVKLDPIRKSGKERHSIYRSLNDDEDDLELDAIRNRESVLDYLDDGDEEDMWEDSEQEELEEEDDETEDEQEED